ncbi:CheY-like superfamily [Aspergillus cavernicola]|uniref:CheY-like superfamily n=1 Tax=Aspergillus cavernicola TaxID=176166 RepID=A0ABR4HSR9_9EURO
MHVLFVDDNYVWQKVATKMLPRLGCTVAVVGNGQQALNYLAGPPASCPPPDLIMMDIAMPGMDGLEATRIIRTQPPFNTDPKTCSTPIVGLCVTGLRSDHDKYIAQGMDDIIVKPWNKQDLERLLRWWSHRQLIPRAEGRAVRASMAPVWGPHPWRAYLGPRSRI